MQDIKILIVDDEAPARKKIRSYLKNEQAIASIEEAETGIEAVQKINGQKPDLVFLDIQMPGMTGFEVIETIGIENMSVVVFVTAYDQYAIDAFEVQAIDYLLKPFDQERFQRSFNRALEQIELTKNDTAILKNLLHEINRGKTYLERIMVHEASHYFFVPTPKIVFISAEEKYVNLYTEKDRYLIRETMTNLEQQFDPSKFKRIHRSYIVNIDFIKEMQPWSHGDYVVILKNGTKLTLSRRFRDRLFGKG
jgi:two-component system LytT family response regulator